MSESLFFDTYALFEIIRGNQNFQTYIEKDIIINDFVYAELCYNLIKTRHPKAHELLTQYAQYISQVEPTWIEDAMHFRLKWKDRNVSMTDCIGYIMAQQLGLRFLTGDKEFEGMENVEFVK